MTHRETRFDAMTRRRFTTLTAGGACSLFAGSSALAQGTPTASPAASPDPRGNVVVETPLGSLRGLQFDRHAEFLGVPYAEPPLGDLRWRAPEPVAPWSDVRDATEPGPIAPQSGTAFAQLDSLNEDCLYLNVTMPSTATAETPQPVMVWIHGGGGTNGAGHIFDARRLAVDEDVVVVTINYRLGIFGAFGYPGLEDSGTFGLLDQQAALGWVRDNIAAFGGDPDGVMLFGESYGALSVSAQLVSPAAEGLFHRAGIQSGLAMIDYPPATLAPETPRLPRCGSAPRRSPAWAPRSPKSWASLTPTPESTRCGSFPWRRCYQCHPPSPCSRGAIGHYPKTPSSGSGAAPSTTYP